MILKELIFNIFHFVHMWFLTWEDVVVLRELIFTVSTLGGCGDLERNDF